VTKRVFAPSNQAAHKEDPMDISLENMSAATFVLESQQIESFSTSRGETEAQDLPA